MYKYIKLKIYRARGNNKQGASIFLAMIMLTLIMSISIGANTILLTQIKNIRNQGYSTVAFYAANSGIEWAQRYVENNEETNNIPWGELVDNHHHDYVDLDMNGTLTLSSDATYEVSSISPGTGECPGAADFCIKSVGIFKGTRRVILTQSGH